MRGGTTGVSTVYMAPREFVTAFYDGRAASDALFGSVTGNSGVTAYGCSQNMPHGPGFTGICTGGGLKVTITPVGVVRGDF